MYCTIIGLLYVERMATKADLEQLFREADVDGSNFLTLAELVAAMKKLGYKGDDGVIKVA